MISLRYLIFYYHSRTTNYTFNQDLETYHHSFNQRTTNHTFNLDQGTYHHTLNLDINHTFNQELVYHPFNWNSSTTPSTLPSQSPLVPVGWPPTAFYLLSFFPL